MLGGGDVCNHSPCSGIQIGQLLCMPATHSHLFMEGKSYTVFEPFGVYSSCTVCVSIQKNSKA